MMGLSKRSRLWKALRFLLRHVTVASIFLTFGAANRILDVWCRRRSSKVRFLDPLIGLGLYLVALVLAIVAHFGIDQGIIRLAATWNQRKIRKAAQRDGRAFFLLLRSFRQDFVYETIGGPAGPKARPLEGSSLLDDVDQAVSAFGPLVILGHEKDSDPGGLWDAVMVRSRDENWWDTLDYAVEEARGILIMPGATPGILKELCHIREKGFGQKTLLLVPPFLRNPHILQNWTQKRYGEWKANLASVEASLETEGIEMPGVGCLALMDESLRIRESFDLGEASFATGLRQALSQALEKYRFPGIPLCEALPQLERLAGRWPSS
jgi:hypothetical protein